MNPRLAIITCTLLSAAAVTVRAELVDIAWSDAGTFTHQTRIAAGKFVELCSPLSAGLKVDWRFDASGPTDFNVHYHQGKEVLFPTKMSQVSHAKDTLRVEVKQDYCWMWSNKSTVTLELKAVLQR